MCIQIFQHLNSDNHQKILDNNQAELFSLRCDGALLNIERMEANLDRMTQRQLARKSESEAIMNDFQKIQTQILILNESKKLQEEYEQAFKDSLKASKKSYEIFVEEHKTEKEELEAKIVEMQKRIMRAKQSISASKFAMEEEIPEYNSDFVTGVEALEKKIEKTKATILSLKSKRGEWLAIKEQLTKLQNSPTAKPPLHKATSIFTTSLKEIEALTTENSD